MIKGSLGGYKTIDKFVSGKLKVFGEMPKTFNSLFKLMFSEKENVMFEKTVNGVIEKITYGDCEKTVLAVRSAIAETGIEKGAAVGIYMDNDEKFIQVFWATLAAGFRPVLINSRLSPRAIEVALKRVNAAAVISTGKTFGVKTVFTSDLFSRAAGKKPTADNISEFGSEFFVMSSGTEGEVKLCAYSAEETYFQIRSSYEMIKKCKAVKKHYDGSLKLLAFLPFYHVFGFFAVYMWFAFFSRTFVLLADLAPNTIVSTVKTHKVTHIFAVPLFWEKVYKETLRKIRERGERTYADFLKGEKISLKLGGGAIGNAFRKAAFKEVRENLFGESVCFMITGGSGIDKNAAEFFNAIGYRLCDGYGMSEIGITSVELSSRFKYLNGLSVGQPIGDTEYRVSEDGELYVKSPSVAEYIINGDKKESFKCKWFATRDLAEKRGDRYYILGRKDDLIVSSSGENINPEIAEKEIAVTAVKRLCLIDADGGATAIAQVSPYIGAEKAQEIREELKKKIADSNLKGEVKNIVLTLKDLLGDDIKVNRKRIKSEYLGGEIAEFRPSAKGEDGDALTIAVRKEFANALNKDENSVNIDADFFFELGGSSLDYFSLVMRLRDKFELPFPDGELFNTVARTVKYIKDNL